MPRVKKGVTKRRRHKKILKMARGFRGTRSKLFRPANEAILHALAYSYRHRRTRKREFRRLWIARINAAARKDGISYSRLISGLRRAGVAVNRKLLADLAISDEAAFGQLVAKAKQNL
ncbi:MAG: 50S ribosomal protein L20 [bacterium]|nr:50S ribosomal protein L20 [bacterium]